MIATLGNGRRIELVLGDITRETVGAIVNAANRGLLPGGGVCGAIHRAGGPEIAAECLAIARQRGPLADGQAVATGAGRVPARHVIHTPGPVWHGGNQGEPEALASCYRESIRLAESLGLESVAFPSISTGTFGYPVELAAPIALDAVVAGLATAEHVQLVRFVLFDAGTLSAYRTAAEGMDANAAIRD